MRIFLFKGKATTENYTYRHTLSLHDALPIVRRKAARKEGERRMNQHDLMVSVLTAAGGESIESHTRPGYTGKIADILFPADDVIVEVKSLTTDRAARSEEHTSELQSLMRISYAVFCLKKKKKR